MIWLLFQVWIGVGRAAPEDALAVAEPILERTAEVVSGQAPELDRERRQHQTQMDEAALNAAALNKGTLQADGGAVLLLDAGDTFLGTIESNLTEGGLVIDAYNALGYALADRNLRLDEAYQLIRKASDLAPQDPFIMDSLGWVEFRLGRHTQAEQTLRRAFEIKSDPEIAAHLGEVLWVQGREDEARQLWRDATAKDPKNTTLKDTLQRLQIKL